jgi:hypothetical protein
MGTLLRPTVHEPAGDELADAAADPESRGGTAEEGKAAPKARKRRTAPTGKTRGFKIHLTEEIHDRLWLTARKRRMSVSAVAMLALDGYLPKLEIREAS